MTDRQGAQARLLKIYQPLKEVLNYLSDSELLDIMDHTYKSVTCDRHSRRAGESLEKSAEKVMH